MAGSSLGVDVHNSDSESEPTPMRFNIVTDRYPGDYVSRVTSREYKPMTELNVLHIID